MAKSRKIRAHGTRATAEEHRLAGDSRDPACETSYAKAKELRLSEHLLDAKELLAKCASASCDGPTRQRCTALYTQVEADIPSVVPAVENASYSSAAEIAVKMDGEPFASTVDGRAIFVDPGNHEFAFSTKDGVFATEKVLILQGDKNRTVSVSQHNPSQNRSTTTRVISEKMPEGTSPTREAIDPEDAEPSTGSHGRTAPRLEAKEGTSWPAYALAGVGVVGLGSAGLLTYWGRQDNKDLMVSCGTDCNPASVHHIRMLYLAADISLGVGVIALATSTWLFMRSGGTEESHGRVAHINRIDVGPIPSGALATVGGTF